MAEMMKDPMEAFMKGYREAKGRAGDTGQRVSQSLPIAADVLELFAKRTVEHMTISEIGGRLALRRDQVAEMVEDLKKRNLVLSTPQGDDLVVELTRKGKSYISLEG